VAGGTAWYAAGIAPEVTSIDATWRTTRLVDADGDGLPDGFPGALSTQGLPNVEQRTYDWFAPGMLRAGFDRGAHQIDFTLIGHASHATRYLANATLSAAGIDRDDYVVDGIATWRGKWTNTRAKLQLAWHRSDRGSVRARRRCRAPAAVTLGVRPTTLAEDPQLAELCNDGTFPGSTSARCRSGTSRAAGRAC